MIHFSLILNLLRNYPKNSRVFAVYLGFEIKKNISDLLKLSRDYKSIFAKK